MKAFYGAFLTETNTFSPIPAGLSAFERTGGPKMPEQWREMLAPFADRGVETVGGFCAFAEPAGTISGQAYGSLRNELLAQVRASLPLDFVVLLLHGAMIADGCDDCEGDILQRVREIVGPKAWIGATLDPHCHLTTDMARASDLLICYKEYPHVDAEARARELVEKLLDAHDRRTRLAWALIDCRTIALYFTDREPMRSYVDRIQSLEGADGIVSISIAHGFPWGDVPEMGTKIIVYANDAADRAGRLAGSLAEELATLRGQTFEAATPLAEAVRIAMAEPGPTVLADAADNPGGGAPGDATFVLRELLDRGATEVAFGPIWDPIAVDFANQAGIGARLRLRIGGKTSIASGNPVDVTGTVDHLQSDFRTPVFGGSDSGAGYGDVAVIRLADSFDVVLTSLRSQVFSRCFFEDLGVRLSTKRIVALKSTHHFHYDYAAFARRIIYVSSAGALNSELETIPYARIRRPIWPLDPVSTASMVTSQ